MHAPRVEASVEGYLALEAVDRDTRHEYWDGVLRAMGGASARHNLVAGGFYAELRSALSGGPCRVFMSDMRTRLSETKYVYPDVVVACPPKHDATMQPETLLNPRFVIEVLSPSTEEYDRGVKFTGYRAVEGLTDYVMAAQDEPRVDHYTRQEDGSWILRTLGPGDPLHLGDFTLDLAKVYAG